MNHRVVHRRAPQADGCGLVACGSRQVQGLPNRSMAQFVSRIGREGGRVLDSPPARQQTLLREGVERCVAAGDQGKVSAD
jgi:hypothetical protein